MVHKVLSVCIFCFICATHSPCGSHAAMNHEPLRLEQIQDLNSNYVPSSIKLSSRIRLKTEDLDTDKNHILLKRNTVEDDKNVKNDEYLNKIFEMFGNGKTMTREGFEKFISQLNLIQVLFDKLDDLNGTAQQPVAKYGHNKEKESCIDKKKIFSSMLDSDKANSTNVNETIDNGMLQRACPAILYSLIVGNCNDETHIHSSEMEEDYEAFTSTAVWVYSMTAVVVTSACGILALIIIPVMQKKFYKPLLQFLVALAVGTLAGDALLHLLPHAMSNSHNGHHHNGAHNTVLVESSMDEHEENMWKGFVAMMGLTSFFFMERLILLAGKWRKQRHKIEAHSHMKIFQNGIEDLNEPDGTQCMDRYNPYPYCYRDIINHQLNNCNETDKTQSTVVDDLDTAVGTTKNLKKNIPEDNQNMTACPAENLSACTEVNKMLPAVKETGNAPSTRSDPNNITIILREHGTSHHGHSHAHGHVHAAPQNFSSVAWMVIMGDGLHNFTDGMAIGAAFSGSLAGGFSTAVAVFCHELPHELGDFAMLLKAGMTIKQALFYNLLSSVLSVLGNIAGIFLGNTEYASTWVFAAAAGMFIYIALVDMIPELSSSHEDESNVTQCCLHMSGLLTGFGVMTLIAFYEHDLKTLFKEPL